MRTHLSLVTKLLVVLLVVLGLGTVQAQDTPKTLTIGTSYIMDTINPTVGYYGYAIRGLFYETLVEQADGSNTEPGLAESWTVSDDGLVWTFKIREGVTFTDGSPATAVEAAWTMNWILENQIPTLVSYLSDITKVEATDATTLVITLDKPVSNMISSKLLYIYIMPPSVWEGKTGDEITTYDDLAVTTGAGPYKLEAFQPDEYMILDANPNYWRGKPPVDQIIYKQYSNDDALIQALLAGEIDMIYVVPSSGVFPLQADANIKVLTGNIGQFADISINSSPDGTSPASLQDPVVRQAMDYAMDRDQIITIAYQGYAQPATTFIPPSMGDYHNTDIPGLTYDITEANRILDEADYVDSDGDGIREYSDGTPLEYRFYADECCAYYVRMLEIIADGFAQAGISVSPITQSTDTLTAAQVDYDFDIILWEWAPDTDPAFLTSVFTCAETQDGGWNDSGYCNPDYDQLYAAQSSALDHEARKDAIWQMQQTIYDNRAWIMIAYTDAISAYRSDRFVFDERLPISGVKWALFNCFQVL